jgi:hypothetical protein
MRTLGARAKRARRPARADRHAVSVVGALPLLVAGIAASMLALALLAPAPAAATACRKLKQVKSFHGQVTVVFHEDASGSDPGSGGQEFIDLHEAYDNVGVKLHRDPAPGLERRGVYLFRGDGSGGKVKIDDTFENTGGTGLDGEATYHKPLPKKNSGGVDVAIDREKCKYVLGPGFHVRPDYSGDADVNPGLAGFVAAPRPDDVSDGLKLKDGQPLHLFEESCETAGGPAGCVNLAIGWFGDYFELTQCHSLDTSHCTLNPDKPVGTVAVAWDLKPTFK